MQAFEKKNLGSLGNQHSLDTSQANQTYTGNLCKPDKNLYNNMPWSKNIVQKFQNWFKLNLSKIQSFLSNNNLQIGKLAKEFQEYYQKTINPQSKTLGQQVLATTLGFQNPNQQKNSDLQKISQQKGVQIWMQIITMLLVEQQKKNNELVEKNKIFLQLLKANEDFFMNYPQLSIEERIEENKLHMMMIDYKKSIKKFTQEKKKQSERQSKNEVKIKSLTEKLQLSQTEINELKKKLQAIQNLHVGHKKLSEQIFERKKKLSSLDQQISSKHLRIQILKNQQQKILKELYVSSDKLNSCNKLISQLQNQIENKLKQLKTSQQNNKKPIDELSQQNEKEELSIQKYEQKFDEVKEKIQQHSMPQGEFEVDLNLQGYQPRSQNLSQHQQGHEDSQMPSLGYKCSQYQSDQKNLKSQLTQFDIKSSPQVDRVSPQNRKNRKKTF